MNGLIECSKKGRLRVAISVVVLSFVCSCASAPRSRNSHWEAVPDARTAIMLSLVVFEGRTKRSLGELEAHAEKLTAERRQIKTGKADPSGDAWLVHVSDEENARFMRECRNCIGGEYYSMVIAARDGRILEFVIPQ